MNKEELENAFNETTDNVVKLLEENVELKNRIDKAIEYIEEEITQGTDIYCQEKVDGIIVLEILKGEDKE